MARQFNGTNQFLNTASTLDLSVLRTITFAFWLYWDAYSDVDAAVLASTNVGSSGVYLAPNASGNSSRGYVRVIDSNGLAKEAAYVRADISAAAWHQYVLEFDLTAGVGVQGIKLWVDNAAQTLTLITAAATTGNFTNDTLNLMARAGGSEWAAGELFAFAIYSGVLTSDQRHALKTNAPDDIGSTPLFYWPLEGLASPEPAAVGGIAMTVTGATQVADPLTFGNLARMTIRKA